ncbi:MAG: glycosyltransferase family 39 protein [Actinomycetota bacterium]|nr:glycosyltransferase family 39 protein [Actinomycetota bacterium]
MSTTPLVSPLRERRAPTAPSLRARVAMPRPELLVLLALAATLNLWALSTNGLANEYYAAAVRSMSTSWHAFLYGSFDVSGVQTVDKPPLALWLQALSVRVFGFHSLAMLVPQALMGMGAVALVYDLVRRPFGRAAGFAGGLALALTPMTVAISRHNNPDALLVLCCTAALWFLVRGLQDGRSKWLVWCGVMIGLGFETKMAAALIVVPGLAAAWLWVAPRGHLTAIRQLALGGLALVAVGGAWPLLMALTPAADRPYVAGTSDNSIWSLIVGYNGLGRVDGQAGGPQAFGGGVGGGGFGGAGSMFGGPTGPLRLVEASLGSQAGWLVGFALVAGLGIAVLSRLHRGDPRTGWVIAAGGAFAACAVTFSYASGIFHPYYVSLLAPFTAALIGGGVGTILRAGIGGRVLAPLAIAGGVITEILVVRNTAGAPPWAVPVAVAAGIMMGVALTGPFVGRARAIALAVVMAALLAAPASWAAQTLGHATSGTFPEGGPASAGMIGGPGGGGFGGRPPGGGDGFGGGSDLTSMLSYVDSHGGGTIAVSSQSGASSAIIAGGARVAGIGGFSGRESDISPAWLAQAVKDGRIRWVVTSSGGMMGGRDGRVGATAAMAAVQKACTSVSSSSALYDCSGRAAGIAAAAG